MGGYFRITPLSSRRAQNRPRHVDAVTVSARPARFGAPMCLMGMSPTHHTIIVIIGAGYAGIMAANRIASRPLATALTRVRLISTSAHLVERIRLHEARRAEEDPVRPSSELLNPAVDVVIGRATSIDRRRGVVRLSDGALRPSTMSSWQPTAPAGHQLVPGRSPGLTTCSRSAMSFSARHTRIRVIGGGLTEIETAAELAEQGFDVEIVDSGTVGSHLGARARKQASRQLRRLGCTVTDDHMCQPEPGMLTIWTAGFAPVTVPCDPPVSTSSDGRIVVNRFLRSPDDPRITAIGDCAAPPASHLRPSCASALSLGAVAADILISGVLKTPAPSNTGVGYVMRCVSLGRDRGLVEHVSPEDVPNGPVLTGRMARRVKDWVMDRTTQWLIEEAQRSGSYRIVRGPAQ